MFAPGRRGRASCWPNFPTRPARPVPNRRRLKDNRDSDHGGRQPPAVSAAAPEALVKRDHIAEWLRTLVGCGVLVLPLLAQQWYSADRAEGERTQQLRGINETRALVELAGPAVPTAEATLVSPADLVRLYRDDPRAADRAYGGRRVTVPVRGGVVRGGEVHWHLGDPANPPVVVFEFAGPPPGGRPAILWITGTVAGAERDDGAPAREVGGYNFHVRITDCSESNQQRGE